MFQVVWLQSALDELAALWMQADSAGRRSITAATESIDQLLQTDPAEKGESRSQGRRILLQPPLGVTFEVRQNVSAVRVLHVWAFRKRGR